MLSYFVFELVHYILITFSVHYFLVIDTFFSCLALFLISYCLNYSFDLVFLMSMIQ